MTAPFDRSAAIARVGFLMPGLNDIGLEGLLKVAEVMAERCARDLTPATLAAEQRAREKPDPYCMPDAVGVIACPTCAATAQERPTVAECFARAEAAGTLVAKGDPVVEGPWSGKRPRSPHDEPRTGYEATTGEEPACSAMPWSPLAAG